MKLECRIKKALHIESPSGGDWYCKLKMNPGDKSKCKKCKHFKVSEYYAYEIAVGLKNGIEKATKAVNCLGDALKGINRKDLKENGRKENHN